MICYIKKIKSDGYWKNVSLIVCNDKEPEDVENYQMVKVDSIRDLI